MIGAKGIIETRMSGKAPKVIYMTTDKISRKLADDVPMQMNPHVMIENDDDIGLLDMRFVVGLTVSIDGADHPRVTAVADKCKASGAKRVISHYYLGIGDKTKLQQIIDTEGILTWESTDW